MFKIGIDATAIPESRVGAGVYTFNLVKGLADIDKENEYFIFSKRSTILDWGINQANFRFVPQDDRYRPLRLLWEQTGLPFLVAKYKLNILHSAHYTSPIVKKCYSVVTFHDMISFIYPGVHTFVKRHFFKKMIQLSVKYADAIVSVSESTKGDIIRYLKISQSKIHVTLEAANQSFRPLAGDVIEPVCLKYGLKPGQFVLFVGTLEPRKNVPALLRAYRGLLERGYKQKLAIVGRRGWMYDDIFTAVKNLELGNDVVFTGYVHEGELPHLYNGASMFVYPSLYEGFGLPVLEAMACGTPVVTSNISSMPEIVGSAGVVVNPYDVDELLHAMEAVVVDKELAKRLRKRGLERAREFSWEKTAMETLKVYLHVCNENNK